MISLQSFKIGQELYRGTRSLLYQGVRLSNNQSVILKFLKDPHPSQERLSLFRREFEIANRLNNSYFARSYELFQEENYWIIVVENFGGTSLKLLNLSESMPIENFLELALKMTSAVGELHQKGILHKDLNPSNIVLNQETGELKIIDFGISTELSHETLFFQHPNQLEGTLAYISPEQTGRMNRSVDYRSDFYSLGATFYELLVGKPPFQSDDALELIHSHLAKAPEPPSVRKSKIPNAISSIVLKLLAKNAENRYQSTFGLKSDLERCLKEYQETKGIPDFTLGQEDRQENFSLPKKLYGRDIEIQSLMDIFEKVCDGDSEALFFYGRSGIGKTALVQELHIPLTPKKGYFISGKFDQFQRNLPYVSLIEAFKSLILQLLTEGEEKMAFWREKISDALGGYGQVIVNVIPEVELVIGRQPELGFLPPNEYQNLFQRVFRRFIQVFAKPEHPLVLFLDDLQWADDGSLNLLETLFFDAKGQVLLLIGSYRDNEVSSIHPLMKLMDGLKQKGHFESIALGPLKKEDLEAWLEDTFHCPVDQNQKFAEVLLKKTSGNPFFVREFLKALEAEKLIVFDSSIQRWDWDIEKIRKSQITENVVEFMTGRIRYLPEETQGLLRLAACIGYRFDLATLSILSSQSPSVVAMGLKPALREEFILPINESYKLVEFGDEQVLKDKKIEYRFIHDRIQQASYSLTSDSELAGLHWKIAQLLKNNLNSQEQEQRVFDLVSQCNSGRELVSGDTDRTELIQLNFKAALKAKGASAFQSAYEYLKICLIELAFWEDPWNEKPTLTKEILDESAEVALLCGEFEEMERHITEILEHTSRALDQVRAFESRILAHLSQARFQDAVISALELVAKFGIVFKENPSEQDISEALLAVLPQDGQSIQSLIDLPAMTNPEMLATLRILGHALIPSWLVMPTLTPMLASKLVKLSIQYGNDQESIMGYTFYAMELKSHLYEIEKSVAFVHLGFRLIEKLNAKRYISAATNCACFEVLHWKSAYKKMALQMKDAAYSGFETGSYHHGASCMHGYVMGAFVAGFINLESLNLEMEETAKKMIETKQLPVLRWVNVYWQAVQNMMGKVELPWLLRGEVYDEETMLPEDKAMFNMGAVFLYNYMKGILCFRFSRYQEALPLLEDTISFPMIKANISEPPTRMFLSLNYLALCQDATDYQREIYLEKVKKYQESVKFGMSHCLANHEHRYLLVEAELARVEGRNQEAREFYDQAIDVANRYEYLNDEALAYELAGNFYLGLGRSKLAMFYLNEALYAYQRWGAIAKVKDLEERYPQLLIKQGQTSNIGKMSQSLSTTSSESGRHSLDLLSVLKATQAISKEIVLKKLLNETMNILLENAGAQKGCLLLESEATIENGTSFSNQWNIVAHKDISDLEHLPWSILNYVVKTQESVVLDNASEVARYRQDPFIEQHQPKSILCLPILHQGKLIALLYVQNDLSPGVFTEDRIEVLNLLSAQAAISLENALLYDTLEQKVQERTRELSESNRQLKDAQTKLVHSEKMNSLGTLMNGVAHEFNNPLNFQSTAIEQGESKLKKFRKTLFSLLDEEGADELAREFNQWFDGMSLYLQTAMEGNQRIQTIVKDLSIFSRHQEADYKETDLEEGIHSTINLLKPQYQHEVDFVEDFQRITKIPGWPSQLNQAFMNIMVNACQAIEARRKETNPDYKGTVTVRTFNEGEKVGIEFNDTGCGMNGEVQKKIFDPFFTTREVGSGVGLGMATVHGIIKQHQGDIQVTSTLGQGSKIQILLPLNKQE